MNKLSLLILLVIGSISLNAQTQIFNSNFEHWTTAENGTDSLIGWSSSNSVVIYPVKSLYQDKDAYEGQYAVNLVTAPFGFVGYTTIGILSNGSALFSYGGGGGGANVEYVSGGGTPISYKPAELRGYYKFQTLSPPDQGLASVILTKYNTTLNKRDTIGFANHVFTLAENYTPFSIPISYLKPGVNPDTITTLFYSSDLNIVNQYGVFSNLFLDGLYLFPEVTSTEEPLENDFNIYPNPCNDYFYIDSKNNKPGTLNIFNTLGQKIKTIILEEGGNNLISVNEISSGTYYIGGQSSTIKKLVVLK